MVHVMLHEAMQRDITRHPASKRSVAHVADPILELRVVQRADCRHEFLVRDIQPRKDRGPATLVSSGPQPWNTAERAPAPAERASCCSRR